MNLTPEQREKLRAAAEVALRGRELMGVQCAYSEYNRLSGPAIIIALLAQLDEAERKNGEHLP